MRYKKYETLVEDLKRIPVKSKQMIQAIQELEARVVVLEDVLEKVQELSKKSLGNLVNNKLERFGKCLIKTLEKEISVFSVNNNLLII